MVRAWMAVVGPTPIIFSFGTELDGLGADGSKGEGHECVEHLLVSSLIMIALTVTSLNTKRD